MLNKSSRNFNNAHEVDVVWNFATTFCEYLLWSKSDYLGDDKN